MIRTAAKLATCLALAGQAAFAAHPCTLPSMIVFDGSRSMNAWGFGEYQKPRILDVRKSFGETLPKLETQRPIGLITFGNGPESYCSNVDLRVSPAFDTAEQIIAVVDELKPDGATPMVKALTKAVEEMSKIDQPSTIVLLSDGADNCQGKPCEMAKDLRQNHSNITVHVIAFRLNDMREYIPQKNIVLPAYATFVARCLADETGGKYISAEDADGLSKAFQETLGCPLSSWHRRRFG